MGRAIQCAVKYAIPSADCLHIATLLELQEFCKEAGDRLVFISADDEQCNAAKGEGITTINPRSADAAEEVLKI